MSQRAHGDVSSEAINNRAHHGVFAFDGHGALLAAEHTEDAFGVFGGIEILKGLPSFAFIIRHRELQHLVHPVVLDDLVGSIIAHQIVVFIVPHETPGADLIPGAAVPQLRFFRNIPVEVLEPNLPVGADGLVELVDGVVNAFVHALHATGDQHLTVEVGGVVFADEPFQLLDQISGFVHRNEFRALH